MTCDISAEGMGKLVDEHGCVCESVRRAGQPFHIPNLILYHTEAPATFKVQRSADGSGTLTVIGTGRQLKRVQSAMWAALNADSDESGDESGDDESGEESGAESGERSGEESGEVGGEQSGEECGERRVESLALPPPSSTSPEDGQGEDSDGSISICEDGPDDSDIEDWYGYHYKCTCGGICSRCYEDKYL